MRRVELVEKLIEISVRLEEIQKDIAEMKVIDKRVDDLETFNSKMKGAGLIISAVGAIVIGVVTAGLHKMLGLE